MSLSFYLICKDTKSFTFLYTSTLPVPRDYQRLKGFSVLSNLSLRPPIDPDLVDLPGPSDEELSRPYTKKNDYLDDGKSNILQYVEN